MRLIASGYTIAVTGSVIMGRAWFSETALNSRSHRGGESLADGCNLV
jgi:hypothetical protein